MVKLQTFDLIAFSFGGDGFQNMLGYLPLFCMLLFIKDKCSEYTITWKLKRLFKTDLYPLDDVFLPNLKQFGYKIGMRFSNTNLVIDKNNHPTKILNAYTL